MRLFDIEIVLRNTEHAVVEQAAVEHDPREWTEADAADVLRQMLLAVNRVSHPDGPEPPVSLLGFSWIVEPFEGTAAVIALEIPMGAAIAGPFDVDAAVLDRLIARALAASRADPAIN
jgi:hypothetical protein